MAEIVAAIGGLPGCRLLGGLTAITIRSLSADSAAAAAVRAQGLAWVDRPGQLAGTDPVIAWRGPRERIAIGRDGAALRGVLQSLVPGRHDTALAADWSEALVVFELHGAHIDAWLARLVDADAIPVEAGRCSSCRLADAAVLLLRLRADRLWLVVDRPIGPYVRDWLTYAHEAVAAGHR